MQFPPQRATSVGGFTAVELVTVCATAGALLALALPMIAGARDGARCRAAARYVAGRLQAARMEALKRSVHVALRVSNATGTYVLATYVDGTGNGVRSAEIASGADPALGETLALNDEFAGVDFGCVEGVPSLDGEFFASGSDPVRLGASSLVSFSPIGGATAGTLYLRDRQDRQAAVRITGATGRVRVLEFDAASGQWITR